MPPTANPFALPIRVILWTTCLLAALAGCGGGSNTSLLPVDPLKVDTSYGVEGTAKMRLPAPSAAALQPDGKLLLAGSRQTGSLPAGNYGGAPAQEVYVRRLTTNGALDPSFGNNGEVKFNVKGSDSLGDIKLQKNGRIVVAVLAGEPCVVTILSISAPCVTASGTSAVRSSNLVALTPDGVLDKTFGQNGVAETGASQNPQRLSLAVKSDQSLLLLRSTGIARFQIYGRSLDRFSANGTPEAPPPQPTSPEACEASGESLLVQNNGRIVSAGGQGYVTYAEPAAHPGVCVATHDLQSGLQTSGAWTRFGGNYTFLGLIPTTDDGFSAVGTSCALKNCQLGVARYGLDGAILTSYGQQGIARMSIPENTYLASALSLPDHSLMVLASKLVYDADFSNPRVGGVWMRMGPNGEPITEFGTQGILSTALSTIAPIQFLPDAQGRWLVVNVDRDPAATNTDNDTVLIQRVVGHSKP